MAGNCLQNAIKTMNNSNYHRPTVDLLEPVDTCRTINVEDIGIPDSKSPLLRSVIDSDAFRKNTMSLPCAIGTTIDNEVFMFDLAEMPHLLIGGATGQGKTNCLHVIILSLLFSKSPEELKLVLIDPKGCEFEMYASRKDFLMRPQGCKQAIITDIDETALALNSLCKLMDKRYNLLKLGNARNINEYNENITRDLLNHDGRYKYMPRIVMIIDEFADLKIASGGKIETPLMRLAQLGHPVGIHLVIATQRPTYNIITGTIKANFPARIAFRVATRIESTVIIDYPDASKLTGKGDMLFSHLDLTRVQCAFVDEKEINRVVHFITQQQD